jgi:phosphoglucosamine mutase
MENTALLSGRILGFRASDEWESQMQELVFKGEFDRFLPADNEIGKNTKINDADGRYIEFAKGTFPRKMSLKGLKIALDCANGAGYRVAPLIFRELDATVFEYGNHPNGLNINDECGSLHPKIIQNAVKEHGADVGIALDGDADRVVMVDENGEIVDGDMILAICAKDLKEKGLLRNNRVVSTVMCNLGFMKAMGDLGIEVIQSKVGDRYVIQDMVKYESNLGGEQSGHLIFLDFNTTGDGLVSALQVLRIMIEKGSSLSNLCKIMKRYPQVCLNVKVASKPSLQSLKGVQEAITEVENRLASQGRVLVRYSGTEMICRVMVEGEKSDEVNALANQIAVKIKQEIGA